MLKRKQVILNNVKKDIVREIHNKHCAQFKHLHYALPKSISNLRRMNFQLCNPFSALLTGPSGCGKTTTLLQVLASRHFLYSKTPGKVIYFYKVHQKSFDDFKHLVDHFYQGLPSVETVEKLATKNDNVTIIFDDLAADMTQDMAIIFTALVHHVSFNCFILTQSLFDNNPCYKIILKNINYLWYFKNPNDSLQLSTLARRVDPERWRNVLESYRHATENAHTYFFIDFGQKTKPSHRYRSNMFFEDGHGLRLYMV